MQKSLGFFPIIRKQMLPIREFPRFTGAARRHISCAHIKLRRVRLCAVTLTEWSRDMSPKIPESLKLEHEELHADLVRATNAGGKTGEAAKAVAKVLHEHFIKEEEFALPPIGLLSALARGEVDKEMRSVLAMTDRLKTELPEMLREHEAVVAALKQLTVAAKEEKLPEHARFAEKLTLHAHTEEDVLYPAAILVGEYLKLKLEI
jgi:hypothetical protein